MNRVPRISFAFFIFSIRSTGCATDVVAAYGIRCAAMIEMMSFLGCDFGCSRGEVVVHAPQGVPEERLRSHPRVNVTWYEAVSFCRWLATLPGFAGCTPCLPVEEEWEVACRAGTSSRFWRGDGDEDLATVGWFAGNAESRTHRVGGKPANPLGLYDVHGNVWEWTASPWDKERYRGREEGVHRIDARRAPGGQRPPAYSFEAASIVSMACFSAVSGRAPDCTLTSLVSLFSKMFPGVPVIPTLAPSS